MLMWVFGAKPEMGPENYWWSWSFGSETDLGKKKKLCHSITFVCQITVLFSSMIFFDE
jgi:hypothetical protein